MCNSTPEIPDQTIANWQRIVDLTAKLANVPASLVMRTAAPDHSVYVTSSSRDNPYRTGQKFTLSERLYCSEVIDRDGELVVEDATCEPRWADNDDLEHGMSFYVGYPLKWPDGALFGTICILDRHRNKRALVFREGLREFARVIEADLVLLMEVDTRARLEAKLQETLDKLEVRVAERTVELEETNTALRVLLSNVEQSRQDYDANIHRQVTGLVTPHLSKLRARVVDDPVAQTYLDLAEENLASLSATRSNGLSSAIHRLTPSELEIAQMVMRGQTTKDIAQTLSRETSTIDFHRNNIRRKLGIHNSGANLRSLLMSSR